MRRNPKQSLKQALLVIPAREEAMFGAPIGIIALLFGAGIGVLVAIISGVFFVRMHRANHQSVKEYLSAIPVHTVQAFVRAVIIISIIAQEQNLLGLLLAISVALLVHVIINVIAIGRKFFAGHFG